MVILINGLPIVQIELKAVGISPRQAMQQIVDYKNAQDEMDSIKNRNSEDSHKANVEKMNYYISNVVPNIMGRPCLGNN